MAQYVALSGEAALFDSRRRRLKQQAAACAQDAESLYWVHRLLVARSRRLALIEEKAGADASVAAPMRDVGVERLGETVARMRRQLDAMLTRHAELHEIVI